MSNKLRKLLDCMNMRVVAEEAGISYGVLRNFKMARKEHLSDEQFKKVIDAIERLTDLSIFK